MLDKEAVIWLELLSLLLTVQMSTPFMSAAAARPFSGSQQPAASSQQPAAAASSPQKPFHVRSLGNYLAVLGVRPGPGTRVCRLAICVTGKLGDSGDSGSGETQNLLIGTH